MILMPCYVEHGLVTNAMPTNLLITHLHTLPGKTGEVQSMDGVLGAYNSSGVSTCHSALGT